MSTIKRIEECGIDLDRGPHGDKWGSSMGILFGIAHALEHAGEDVPHELGYRDALGCRDLDANEDYEAIAITEAVARGDLDWTEVRRAAHIFNRYTDRLERAGLSY